MRRCNQPRRRRIGDGGILAAAIQCGSQGLAGPCGANRVEETLPLRDGLQAALGGWLQRCSKLGYCIQLRPSPGYRSFPSARHENELVGDRTQPEQVIKPAKEGAFVSDET